MDCKNCGAKLYGAFCAQCGTENDQNPENQNTDVQSDGNVVMTHINKKFEDAGCQSVEYFLNSANFIRFLYIISAFIAIIVFIYAFIQNVGDGIVTAFSQSALASALFTYFAAVIINGTYYDHKYYNECALKYVAGGKPLDAENICKFMAGNIDLPEFSNWTYGYDHKFKCGFVEYSFKGKAERQVILLYPNNDSFNIRIGESYFKTNMFGTFSFRQVKYYNDLKIAKTVVIPAMSYYLERI